MDVVTTLQRLREQRPGIFTSQVMKRSRREEGKRGMKGREEREAKRRGKREKVGGGERLIFYFLCLTSIIPLYF